MNMDEPYPRPTIFEAIDNCRPGSADLDLPEMQSLAARVEVDKQTRQLYERTQQLDVAIAAAIHDVPVPSGLLSRLLASLNRDDSRRPVSESSAMPVNATHGPRERPEDILTSTSAMARPSSQKWKWVGLISAMAACLCVVALASVTYFSPSPEIPFDQLVKDVLKWVDEIPAGQWHQDLSTAPKQRAWQSQTSFPSSRQWQQLGTNYDQRTVVYDLRENDGQDLAFVIVLRSSQRFAVPRVLPEKPASTTRGVCIGAFQRDDVLYVLVVEGDQRLYRRFAKSQGFVA